MKRLQEFLNTQHSLSDSAKYGYIAAIRAFDKAANSEFEDVYTDKILVNAALDAMLKKYKDESWNLHLTLYKRYAKWLYDPDDEAGPKFWRKIKPLKVDYEKKLKNKCLSDAEFNLILNVVDSPRDHALFCVAKEGGLRLSEVLNLTVGDCKPKTFCNVPGFSITVSGKTGTSTVAIVSYAPSLRRWLNVHPLKNDPNAPLWLHYTNGEYTSIKQGNTEYHFVKYCRRAGLNRHLNFHSLRHTAITNDVRKGIQDQVIKKMARWTPNSRMLARYTHLNDLDAEKGFLEVAGIKVTTEPTKPLVAQFRCVGCGELNAVGALYCSKCGLVLDEEQARRIVEKQRLTDEIMKRLLNKDGGNIDT